MGPLDITEYSISLIYDAALTLLEGPGGYSRRGNIMSDQLSIGTYFNDEYVFETIPVKNF